MPRIYIGKLFNELRDELLAAMHDAVAREVRAGRPVDVPRMLRTFTRAAAGKMANPVEVSDKCLEPESTGIRSNRGRKSSDFDETA